MTKKNLAAVFLAAAVALSGCTICTDCGSESEYRPAPTTIYRYTAYPGGPPPAGIIRRRPAPRPLLRQFSAAPVVDFSRMPHPAADYTAAYPMLPGTPVYRPVPADGIFWTRQPVSSGYYNYNNQYGGGYSGPPFQTPPMQPMPYPAEGYYPFKRPAPGIFVPWNRMYYPTTQSSSYYYQPQNGVAPAW